MRARVLAALRVVRRSRRKGMRPSLLTVAVALVEALRRDAYQRGLAADFVQRGERVEAIERGVFEPFRRDGARQLLEAQGEVSSLRALLVCYSARVFQEQKRAYEVEDRSVLRRVPTPRRAHRRVDVEAVVRADGGLRAAYVRAIDREARDDFGERVVEAVLREVARVAVLLRDARQLAREHVQLRRHRRLEYQTLALVHEV